MTSGRFFASAAIVVILSTSPLRGQDRNHPTEPNYPPTCGVYSAPLVSTADGPRVGDTWAAQDDESRRETNKINTLLLHCSKISKGSEDLALELATGNNGALSAFLIKPIELPPHVSLIVDGGVTVYGSRDPGAYQILKPKPPTSVCGETGTWPINSGCNALITMSSHTGIYGNGVIDGQGNKLLLSGKNGPSGNKATWWDLTLYKNNPHSPISCSYSKPKSATQLADGDSNTSAELDKKPSSDCIQQNPLVVSSAAATSKDPITNLILYKITIRNPPYHTSKLNANDLVVWSVKVQSPWNIPNTDGFDVRTTDATFYDDTVANGDQEIAIVSINIPTSHMTIENFHGYGKGGITILGNGKSVSQIFVKNAQITGDLPSVVGTDSDNPVINGVPYSVLKVRYDNLASWGQALPNATNDLKALQITNEAGGSGGKAEGAKIDGVTFQSVCISDIVRPIDISLGKSSEPGYAQGIEFRDVHVLKPTEQFPSMSFGMVQTSNNVPQPGQYSIFFDAPSNDSGVLQPNEITFDNLVFDDLATNQSSIGEISALGNQLTASTNAYPPALYKLAADTNGSYKPIDGIPANLRDNKYLGVKGGHDEYLANACHSMPFITGDLSLSSNRVNANVHAGDSVTLNAVVQPIMSQTTLYVPKSYGASPGLVSIGSPALTNAVQFYDGFTLVGSANLTANGTLASFTIPHLAPGTHYFRALYPADKFYASLPFGLVTIVAEAAGR